MGRDHARFRRNRSWKGEAMSVPKFWKSKFGPIDLTPDSPDSDDDEPKHPDPRGNVPLCVQEAIRETLTTKDKALLAFFEAPGFVNKMTKKKAFEEISDRLKPTTRSGSKSVKKQKPTSDSGSSSAKK